MNDRFRFRVWVKTANSYISEKDEADIVRLEEDGKIVVGLYDGDLEDMIYLKEQNLIIEQCTGLKDKNGRLIYEGDILEFYDWQDDNEHTGPIEFIATDACFGIRYSQCVYMPLSHLSTTEDCEIIGNIHENPELLEDK